MKLGKLIAKHSTCFCKAVIVSIDDEYDIESIKPIRDKRSKTEASSKENATSGKKKVAPLKKESLLKPAAKAVNKELATARKLREFIHPMTAKLHDVAFNDDDNKEKQGAVHRNDP